MSPDNAVKEAKKGKIKEEDIHALLALYEGEVDDPSLKKAICNSVVLYAYPGQCLDATMLIL